MFDHYIKLLKSGEVVAFPTETVYGLGADAWNLSAVKKIFSTKKRPADNPLIVHISSRAMLHPFAAEIPPEAKRLMDAFWPGPLTLIFKKKPDVLDAITAGLDTVAVRRPAHPLAQKLISQVGPLVAPSANSSGRPSPTRPQHVKEDFGEEFPVVEGGETQIGLESTVLDVSSVPFTIYRPGGISAEQIENIIKKSVETGSKSVGKQAARSPGTKYSHYAPEAQVRWLKDEEISDSNSVLYLLHTINPTNKAKNIIFFEENYEMMAHQLFDRFREADHQGYREVQVEPFTNLQLRKVPLAPAIQNRISKAVGPDD
ncbi:MAG TPA: L-threonylcarbamoyladenylate synthase [Balneolaceae bacterium]|nr:L-threonylcarbamoyladenylate synthase [Balneolaceae bacterium]